MGKTLGTGSFGRVLLGEYKEAFSDYNRYYAIKSLIKNEVIRLKQVEHIEAEKEILQDISKNGGHPFVVNLIGM